MFLAAHCAPQTGTEVFDIDNPHSAELHLFTLDARAAALTLSPDDAIVRAAYKPFFREGRMRLRSELTVVVVSSLMVAAFAPIGAQMAGPSFNLEGSAVWITLSGDDFDNTDAGFGFDLAAVLGINNRWAIAGGVARTTHDDADVDDNIAALQLYAEPRFMLPAAGMVTPYLFGRVAWVRTTSDIGGADVEQTGTVFGGGIGVMFGGSRRWSFIGSASLNGVSLGDGDVDGTTIPGTDVSGSAFMLRGGVRILVGR